jgi:hypothetical protein
VADWTYEHGGSSADPPTAWLYDDVPISPKTIILDGPLLARSGHSSAHRVRSDRRRGEADVLLRAIENLSDGVPSCIPAAGIPSYCSQRYFDPRGVEK